MFTNINREEVLKLYSLYKTGEYDIFFRHYDDFLNLDEFTQTLGGFKWLVTEEGFISLNIEAKSKLCIISILLYKEYQSKGIGLKTMMEIGKYLFSNGIERLVVLVVEEDTHTVKMCIEGGFDKEGTYINSCKINGLTNEIRFGISKEKFEELYGGQNG